MVPQLSRSLVGSLMYASVATRGVEIGFAVKELSKYLCQPTDAHMQMARRVLAYLHQFSALGPTYSASGGAPLFFLPFAGPSAWFASSTPIPSILPVCVNSVCGVCVLRGIFSESLRVKKTVSDRRCSDGLL